MRVDLDVYERLLKERDILMSWYIQGLEHYDGLTTRQELEREVREELRKAVDSCGIPSALN